MVIDEVKVTNSIQYCSKTVGKDIYPAHSCTLNNHFRQYFKKYYNCNAIIMYFTILLIPYIIKKSPNID